MWAKIISFAAKYGIKAVKWCWEHKFELLSAGELAFDLIKNMFS